MRVPLLVVYLAMSTASSAQSLAVSASPGGVPLAGTLSIGNQPGYLPPGYAPPGTGVPSYTVPLPGQNPLGSIQAAQVAAQQASTVKPPSLLDEAAASPAPTAAEQGASFTDPAAEARALADERARHTDRQEGRRSAPPGPASPVGADRSLSPWVHAWTGLLLNAGVSGAKIRFETNRLDATEFAHWASRQVAAAPEATLVAEGAR